MSHKFIRLVKKVVNKESEFLDVSRIPFLSAQGYERCRTGSRFGAIASEFDEQDRTWLTPVNSLMSASDRRILSLISSSIHWIFSVVETLNGRLTGLETLVMESPKALRTSQEFSGTFAHRKTEAREGASDPYKMSTCLWIFEKHFHSTKCEFQSKISDTFHSTPYMTKNDYIHCSSLQCIVHMSMVISDYHVIAGIQFFCQTIG